MNSPTPGAQEPQIIPIEPQYKKENGVYVFDIDAVEVPFPIQARCVVHIPAGEFGGNHKHPRQEAFVGIGTDLELVWQADGVIHRAAMNPNGEHVLFVIPPYVPHAVVNNSEHSMAVLIEYADGPQRDVEPVDLLI